MVFAERLIRSDGEAAMRSQDGVDDLVQPSNDSRESKPASLSSLEKLSGARSGIKIKRESDDQTDNVVPFNPKKKQSE